MDALAPWSSNSQSFGTALDGMIADLGSGGGISVVPSVHVSDPQEENGTFSLPNAEAELRKRISEEISNTIHENEIDDFNLLAGDIFVPETVLQDEHPAQTAAREASGYTDYMGSHRDPVMGTVTHGFSKNVQASQPIFRKGPIMSYQSGSHHMLERFGAVPSKRHEQHKRKIQGPSRLDLPNPSWRSDEAQAARIQDERDDAIRRMNLLTMDNEHIAPKIAGATLRSAGDSLRRGADPIQQAMMEIERRKLETSRAPVGPSKSRDILPESDAPMKVVAEQRALRGAGVGRRRQKPRKKGARVPIPDLREEEAPFRAQLTGQLPGRAPDAGRTAIDTGESTNQRLKPSGNEMIRAADKNKDVRIVADAGERSGLRAPISVNVKSNRADNLGVRSFTDSSSWAIKPAQRKRSYSKQPNILSASTLRQQDNHPIALNRQLATSGFQPKTAVPINIDGYQGIDEASVVKMPARRIDGTEKSNMNVLRAPVRDFQTINIEGMPSVRTMSDIKTSILEGDIQRRDIAQITHQPARKQIIDLGPVGAIHAPQNTGVGEKGFDDGPSRRSNTKLQGTLHITPEMRTATVSDASMPARRSTDDKTGGSAPETARNTLIVEDIKRVERVTDARTLQGAPSDDLIQPQRAPTMDSGNTVVNQAPITAKEHSAVYIATVDAKRDAMPSLPESENVTEPGAFPEARPIAAASIAVPTRRTGEIDQTEEAKALRTAITLPQFSTLTPSVLPESKNVKNELQKMHEDTEQWQNAAQSGKLLWEMAQADGYETAGEQSDWEDDLA